MVESAIDPKDPWWRFRIRPRGRHADAAAARSDHPRPTPIVDGRTAQVVYQALLKDRISPGLRALGFTGSGGTYLLKSPTHWVQVGLQKSAHSDGAEIRFCANLSVVRKDLWAAKRAEHPDGFAEKPAPTYHYGDPVQVRRLRSTPDAEETWFVVTHDGDPAQVAAAFLREMETYGLSFLRAVVDEG